MGSRSVLNNVRKLRFNNDEMTQQQLADKVGVTRQTIVAIEGGKYSPSLELSFRIAHAFGEQIENVFSYDPNLDPINKRKRNKTMKTTNKMKSIVFREYGGPEVLKLEEIETPIIKNNEVLVKIFAVNVNFGDIIVRKFNRVTPKKFNMPFVFWFLTKFLLGIRKPKINIVGSEYSGIIDGIGKRVTNFNIGDEVFGYRSMKMGANAQFIAIPAVGLIIHKPKNVTFEEAATFPYGGLTALNLLRKANIKVGQKVLIIGASGSIGSHAVQLAKHYGAEVTGVCGTERMDFVKSLGADKVIDYTKEDFAENGESYDVILDILGRSSFSKCKKSLTESGIYLLASFKMKQLTQMIWTKIFGSKKVVCALSTENYDDLVEVKNLIEKGVLKSIIDKKFPLEETAKAHEYIESGNKKAQVVITVDH